MTTDREPCRLYLITPEKIDDVDAFARTLDETFAAGDVACLQLRLKGVTDDEVIAASKALMPVCEKYDVAFLINDRVDLAIDAGADGVHLGQGDGDVKVARERLGFEKSIGVTCHNSLHLAYTAGESGADYVAFGAFFPTTTKDVSHRADTDLLSTWQEVTEIPSVAIGGITLDTARSLADAGADFIAVCSGVWDYRDGPAAAVRAFNQALEA